MMLITKRISKRTTMLKFYGCVFNFLLIIVILFNYQRKNWKKLMLSMREEKKTSQICENSDMSRNSWRKRESLLSSPSQNSLISRRLHFSNLLDCIVSPTVPRPICFLCSIYYLHDWRIIQTMLMEGDIEQFRGIETISAKNIREL